MRRLALSAGAVLTIAISVLTTAFSQQPPQSPSSLQVPSEPQATFKATTRIVNVNVVVTDPHGNPIIGLTKDDFELFDNGKPQTVSFFQALENVPPAFSAPLPPDTYSNLQPIQGAPPNVTALLVDFQHSDWQAEHYLLYHLRAFLRKLHPNDHIALYVLTDDRVLMLHDFTHDSSDVVTAIRRYDSEQGVPKDQRKSSAADASDLDRLLSGDDTQFRFDDRQSELAPHQAPRMPPITTLTDIVRHLASAPGRKSLVWLYGATRDKRVALSATRLLPDQTELQDEIARRVVGSYYWPPKYSGVKAFLLGPNGPIDPHDRALKAVRAGLYSSDLVPLLTRLFNDNAISVYPVDAAGLQTKGFGGFEDLGFRTPWALPSLPTTIIPNPRDPPIDWAAMHDDEVHGSMSSIAKRTGGRAFYNRNDLETGIQHALDDGRYTYELAYYPDHNDWRGEWRKIRVKLKDPNRFVQPPHGLGQDVTNFLIGGYSADVLARGGYYAFPESKPLKQGDRKELLGEVAVGASNVADLPFMVRVLPLSAHDNSEIMLFLNIDARNLLAAQTQDHWKADFEVLFFQLTNEELAEQGRGLSNAPHKGFEPPVLLTRSELPGMIQVPLKNYLLDLNAAEYHKAITRGMAMTRRLKLDPAASTLVVVLHDKTSDAVGSVHVPLAQYKAAVHQTAMQH